MRSWSGRGASGSVVILYSHRTSLYYDTISVIVPPPESRMPRNSRTPKFIISGLVVPAEDDCAFRWIRAQSGVKVLSVASIRR